MLCSCNLVDNTCIVQQVDVSAGFMLKATNSMMLIQRSEITNAHMTHLNNMAVRSRKNSTENMRRRVGKHIGLRHTNGSSRLASDARLWILTRSFSSALAYQTWHFKYSHMPVYLGSCGMGDSFPDLISDAHDSITMRPLSACVTCRYVS